MITINIEIKKHNRIKEFFLCCCDKIENSMFWILEKIPEKFIPNFLMNWLDKYTAKKINKLKQEIVKDRWKEAGLEKALDNIQSR